MIEEIKRILQSFNEANKMPGDYEEDGFLICGKCHTRKQMDSVLPASIHVPEEIVRINVMCECATREFERQKEYEKQRANEQRVRDFRNDGMRLRAYINATFETDDKKNPIVTDACRRYVKNWQDMKQKAIGMIFCGDVGVGKTFYAAMVANALIDKRVRVCMITTSDYLSMSFDERSTFLAAIRRYRVYVLDDFGAERSTTYAEEQMKLLIDAIYNSKRILIVTTNLSLMELEDKHRAMEERRIYGRVLERCSTRVIVEGPSRRPEKAIQRIEIAKKILGY